LENAVKSCQKLPEIFHTHQGSQFIKIGSQSQKEIEGKTLPV